MSVHVGKGGQSDRSRMLDSMAGVFGERRAPGVERVMAELFWHRDSQPRRSSAPGAAARRHATVTPLGTARAASGH